MHTSTRKLLFPLLALGLVAVAGAMFMSARDSFAVHDNPPGLFQLDRDAVDVGVGDDWSVLDDGPGDPNNDDSALANTGILCDIVTDTSPCTAPLTEFFAGGSKDIHEIGHPTPHDSHWLWNDNEPLDKDDISDAYAAAYTNTVDTGSNNVGDTIVYFGLDRFANDGTAQVGFWFLQDDVGLTDVAEGGGFRFSGFHQVHDVLVQSNFTGGGVISSVTVYEWTASGLSPLFAAADCVGPPVLGADDPACATANRIDPAPSDCAESPWPYEPKDGASDTEVCADTGEFPHGSFFEGGVNITRLVPDAGCFSTVVAETRTSAPFDSRLKDFVLGDFELCDLAVTKTGDTISKVGDDVDYTVTIENTGGLTLYKDDITDTLLGDVTLNGVDQANSFVQSNTCGASLAPGATCTITFTRTVLAGDPDPLPNTVTVVYNVENDLTGDEVTREDDHEVNLFQPSITVDKTGDELSKIGDVVSYTIEVCNTSSDDTPTLIKDSVTDSLTGPALSPDVDGSFGASLAVGDCESHDFTRTVQAGDPDPLVNTATAHYHPDGFGNDITNSDDHSVNLFQPDVDVEKTGDTLSKIGDPVDYTITVTNTSSKDSPDLVNGTIVDDVLGDLLDAANPYVTGSDCTTTLADNATCTITATRTVLDTDPDPLVNTVEVHYNPDGFPNDITDSDDHSVNLFQPDVDVEKTGDTLSKIGDPVDYTITVTNTSSKDSPDLVNGTIVDDVLGDLLDAANPYVTGSDCTTTLADNATCTITATRTVLDTDPDPLVNTVEVHYNPDGFPNDITDSDDHSVNLFQPDVDVEKTGDTLSKIGDPVDYTITVTNTSSKDSPDLVNGTIVDDVLGDLLDAANPYVTGSDCTTTLADNATCTITATRTVLDTDPDPLVNTVEVHYNPDGFPNDITDSDDHSVNLFQPDVDVEKTGDTLSKIGDPVDYTITVTNTSSKDSPDLVNGTIVDDVLGDLLDAANPYVTGSDCTTTLADNATCTITATRTVLDTDPDPLVNTVEVHYNPDGFPNDITDSDDHSVNLFQPDVDVEKTGDTLSKIGDPVDYTITVTNTSSKDSPDLVNGTIVDDVLGDLLDAANPYVTGSDCTTTLADNATCTITATRTVLDTDPDPLVNTVEVHYNPDGFPNDITDSDDHSVNLFQPDVDVEKTGDTLSKIGDPVDYTITVTNTSSKDSPDLVNGTIVDDVLGDLLDAANPYVTGSDCTTTLADNATCTITATRTVLDTDPDPLVNTVEVHYNPDGFPNDITDSDDHSVNLFQPDVDVEKTGDTFSKAGDPVNYTITVTNTSSKDSPDLVNGTIVDDVLGDLLDAANPYVTGSDCTTTLADNATCTITATRTVLDTDPDPLVNTVEVHYNPDGFPNDITDSDDHSVDLVHPSIDVLKDCAPATATVGSVITYTCSIENTGDVQLLLDNVQDSLKGDVTALAAAAGCDVLDIGETCSFTYTRTIVAGDPNPVVNTVTAHYDVAGLPNDITDNDSCSVTIVGCALSPGFWGGGAGTQKWDQVNDPIAISAGFATDSCFPWVAASVPNPGTSSCRIGLSGSFSTGLTYLEVLKLSGSDTTIQLVFKYIAARLNQASCDAGVTALCPPGSIDLNDLLGQVEDYFDPGTGNACDDDGCAQDSANLPPDDNNTTDQWAQAVGSNPSGPARNAGRALLTALNSYFSTVGEAFCPPTSSIPEA